LVVIALRHVRLHWLVHGNLLLLVHLRWLIGSHVVRDLLLLSGSRLISWNLWCSVGWWLFSRGLVFRVLVGGLIVVFVVHLKL